MAPGEPQRRREERARAREERRARERQGREARRQELRQYWSRRQALLQGLERQVLGRRRRTPQGRQEEEQRQEEQRQGLPLLPAAFARLVHILRAHRALLEEGLFRVPGRAQAVAAVLDLVLAHADDEALARGGAWRQVHDVASALKLYLQSLEEPLCTFALYDEFVASHAAFEEAGETAAAEEEWLAEAGRLLDRLPAANRSVLAALVHLLCDVVALADSNRMTAANCSVVFGPVVLRPRAITAEYIFLVRSQCKLVELMLRRPDVLFGSHLEACASRGGGTVTQDDVTQDAVTQDAVTQAAAAATTEADSETESNADLETDPDSDSEVDSEAEAEAEAGAGAGEWTAWDPTSDSAAERRQSGGVGVVRVAAQVGGRRHASTAAPAVECVGRAPPPALAAGAPVPNFQALTHAGVPFDLWRDVVHLGRRAVVLFFGPTLSVEDIKEANAAQALVFYADCAFIGVAGCDRQELQALAEQQEVSFTLLSDADGAVSKLFGLAEPVASAEWQRMYVVGASGELLQERSAVPGGGSQLMEALTAVSGSLGEEAAGPVGFRRRRIEQGRQRRSAAAAAAAGRRRTATTA